MRILMVNDYKYNIAGTEIYMFQLIELLQKRGHEVNLFASDVMPNEYFSPRYNKAGKDYVKRIYNVGASMRFKEKVRYFRPDIIHIHNIYNEITPAILLWLKKEVVIMTVHGSQMLSPVSLQTDRTGKPCQEEICEGCSNCVGWKGSLYEYAKRTIYRFLLKRIDMFVTPSEYLRKALREKKYLPVVRIYNGIHLLQFSKILHPKQLLFVGRLTKEKGLDILLESIALVKETIPDIHLTIVGKGNYLQQINDAIVRLGIQPYVTIVNGISSGDIQKYYTDSTLLLIPSVYPDNLPTVGLEALSVGRPIIGSNIGGISEIIKNTDIGILTPPGDVRAVSNAIISMVGNKKKLDTMNHQTRKYAKEQFDIQKHVLQIETLYATLLKQKNPSL